MNMKCIIVEDEPKAAALLQEYIGKTPLLELSDTFHSAQALPAYLLGHSEVELVFLDINLPDLSGMDAAKLIPPNVMVIFTTAYSSHAVESYEVNTVDYLLKPITYPRFFRAVTKASQRAAAKGRKEQAVIQQEKIFLKTGKKMIQVNWSDIVYIEAQREYLSVVTGTQKLTIYKRMAEFERLQPENFRRVHNSFIVNLDKIERVEDAMIYIQKREIPVSRSYKEAFYRAIQGRLF